MNEGKLIPIVIFSGLFYFLFYHKKRYERIFEKYRNSAELQTRKAKLIGFGIVVFLILLPFITAVLVMRIETNEWIKFSGFFIFRAFDGTLSAACASL